MTIPAFKSVARDEFGGEFISRNEEVGSALAPDPHPNPLPAGEGTNLVRKPRETGMARSLVVF
jgi:hypothetical protein